MPSAARPSRPSLGLAIALFLVTADVGAAIRLTELGDTVARATRRGVDLWMTVGLGGQILRIVGPLLGTVLVLQPRHTFVPQTSAASARRWPRLGRAGTSGPRRVRSGISYRRIARTWV